MVFIKKLEPNLGLVIQLQDIHGVTSKVPPVHHRELYVEDDHAVRDQKTTATLLTGLSKETTFPYLK